LANRLVDEVRDAVAERVDLDGEIGGKTLLLAQQDQPVEEAFPILVAGEIVVGDEEGLDALREVLAEQGLEIVGRPETAPAPLVADDRAEAALKRAAATEIDARPPLEIASDHFLRQPWHRRSGEARKIVEIIVDRLQPNLPPVEQGPHPTRRP